MIADFPAFDATATNYDAEFTSHPLGRWLRNMVWNHLRPRVVPGQAVLELNAGTGEDACWLASRGAHVTVTDASPVMRREAARKAHHRGVDEQIAVAPLDLNRLDEATSTVLEGPFDGVLSNFGGLNCVADRRVVATWLAERTAPGAWVGLVLMGPACAWEIAWHLAHAKPRPALRRFRSGRLAHVGEDQWVPVWYPSPRRLRKEFEPHFVHRRTVGIGTLLPPSYLAHLVDRWPRAFSALHRIDAQVGKLPPAAWLSDHYLMLLERRA